MEDILDNLVLRNAETEFIDELRLKPELASGLKAAWTEHGQVIAQKVAYAHHSDPKLTTKV
jgi:hypothetical protein